MARDVAESTTMSASLPGSMVPFCLLLEAGVGRAPGVGADGFLDGDLLLRHPAAGVLAVERAARDGGVDAQQRLQRRDVPVRAEGQHGAGVEQGAEGVGALGALRADALLRPAAVVDGVVGLHGGDDAQPAKRGMSSARRCCACSMRKRRSRGAVGAHGLLEDVEDQVIGLVADGVHGHLQAGAVGLAGCAGASCPRESSRRWRGRGVRRVEVGLEEQRGGGAERAVGEALQAADVEHRRCRRRRARPRRARRSQCGQRLVRRRCARSARRAGSSSW